MNLKEFLSINGMDILKINPKYLDIEVKFSEADKKAAWDLYIELITRTTTQQLPAKYGDEQRALESVHEIFPLTRQIIKENGRKCIQFTKIAVIVLNQVLRPFTAKWHKLCLEGAFKNQKDCKSFRTELAKLQITLKNYTRMLSAIAEVEDLTNFQES